MQLAHDHAGKAPLAAVLVAAHQAVRHQHEARHVAARLDQRVAQLRRAGGCGSQHEAEHAPTWLDQCVSIFRSCSVRLKSWICINHVQAVRPG